MSAEHRSVRHLTRKDIDTDKIFFNAVLQDTKFRKVGAVVITGITNESVKVQFLEKRSYQNFYPHFDENLCKPNPMSNLFEHW